MNTIHTSYGDGNDARVVHNMLQVFGTESRGTFFPQPVEEEWAFVILQGVYEGVSLP